MRTRKKKNNNNNNNKYNIIYKKINNYNVFFVPYKSNLLSIQSFIFNGFLNESINNVGINHLLEHILTSGFKKCNENCNKYFDINGLIFNAYTSNNIIKYYISGLFEDYNLMIEYICQISTNPEITENIINRERKAICNELNYFLNNDESKIFNKINKEIYSIDSLKNRSNYKLQINNLQKFNLNFIKNYFYNNYNFNNTIFIIAGDLNKINSNMSKIYNLFKKNIKLENIHYNYRIQDCFKFGINPCFSYKPGIFFIKNTKLSSCKVFLTFPTLIHFNSFDETKINLSSNILKSICFQRLRFKENLVYEFFINLNSDFCGTIISINFSCNPKNVRKSIQIIYDIFEKYSQNLLPKNLFDSYKKFYLIKFNQLSKNPTAIADFYGKQAIYNKILNFPLKTHQCILREINSIKRENLIPIIKDSFNFNKCIIINSYKFNCL